MDPWQRTSCPKCAAPVHEGESFCGTCGTPLKPSAGTVDDNTGNAQPQRSDPRYAWPIAPEAETGNRSAMLLVSIVALAAGLAVGGVIFLRMHHAPSQTAQIGPAEAQTSEPPVQTPPSPTQTRTAAADKKPPMSGTPVAVTRKQGPQTHAQRGTPESVTPPELLPDQASTTPPSQASDPTATATTAAASPADSSAPPKRRAVQENEAETSPLPAAPQPGATATPSISSTFPPAPPQTSVPSQPAYSGPPSGVATWTGKLDKGQTLSITRGTPSIGILSGAGLPGVPVAVTLDQTNLGFVETPSAANGYERIVIKAHSKHNRIVIRWTVTR